MCIRRHLSDLYANRYLSIYEYKELSVFTALEKEDDIIEKIEKFNLPEITKMICGSETLGQLPWAKKYKKIKPLYDNLNEIDINKIFKEYENISDFENEILQFADNKILQKFDKYYKDLNQLKKEKTDKSKALKKEKKALDKEIKDEQKRLEKLNEELEKNQNYLEELNEENKKDEEIIEKNNQQEELNEDDKNDKISKITKNICNKKSKISKTTDNINIKKSRILKITNEYEELKTSLDTLDKDIDSYEPHNRKVLEYLDKVKSDEIENNRDKAYEIADEIANMKKLAKEECFLEEFIYSSVISEEDRIHLSDDNFLKSVLKRLEEENFKNYSIKVLLKLCNEKIINLTDGYVRNFINRNPELLCNYLVSESPISEKELNNSELIFLIEEALKIEIRNVWLEQKKYFSSFWNTITDCNIWCWIICKINEIKGDEHLNTCISWLLLNLEGKAAKSLVGVIFDETKFEFRISTEEVVSSLLKYSDNPERDVIIEVIRLLEQDNRKIKRNLNTANRKLRSNSQDLFSCLYEPIEQLEELSINLKSTERNINASVVANQLIDIVLLLREELDTFGLQPLVKVDDWKNQQKVKFDANIHRVASKNNSVSDKVTLRSIGFRYRDDEEQWQTYNAKASFVNRLPVNDRKSRNENHKKKKVKMSVNNTTNKKKSNKAQNTKSRKYNN